MQIAKERILHPNAVPDLPEARSWLRIFPAYRRLLGKLQLLTFDFPPDKFVYRATKAVKITVGRQPVDEVFRLVAGDAIHISMDGTQTAHITVEYRQ